MNLDYPCILASRTGIPHGYVLPNGVVVVWPTPTTQRNFVNETFARQAYPNLVLL